MIKKLSALGFAGICLVLLPLQVATSQELAKSGKYTGIFSFLGDGTVHNLEEGHIFWVGEFTGLFFNDSGGGFMHHAAGECPGADDINFNDKKESAMGYCIMTDGDGDTAFLVWRCEGDTTSCPGTFEWTGGTGKYQGLSGKNTFVGRSGPINPTGRQSGHATWDGEWKLP